MFAVIASSDPGCADRIRCRVQSRCRIRFSGNTTICPFTGSINRIRVPDLQNAVQAAPGRVKTAWPYSDVFLKSEATEPPRCCRPRRRSRADRC